MVIFQHRSIVVEKSKTTARIDVKVVGRAGMVKVVNNGGHQRGEDLQVRHPILQGKRNLKKKFTISSGAIPMSYLAIRV